MKVKMVDEVAECSRVLQMLVSLYSYVLDAFNGYPRGVG
jgi:hypothetical protein